MCVCNNAFNFATTQLYQANLKFICRLPYGFNGDKIYYCRSQQKQHLFHEYLPSLL